VPELNTSFMKDIVSALDSTRFSASDFDLNEDEYGELLRVQFKYDDRFTFILKEEEVSEEVTDGRTYGMSSKTYSKTVVKKFTYESPGEYKSQDKIAISSFSNVPKRIGLWCQNIHRELGNEVTVDASIEEAKESFRQAINFEIDDPDSKFTAEESEELSLKLDTLFSKVSELSEKLNISDAELQKLRGDLDNMRDNTKTYKKGMWAKMTENKLTAFVFEFLKSKEGRNLIVESIKKLGSGM